MDLRYRFGVVILFVAWAVAGVAITQGSGGGGFGRAVLLAGLLVALAYITRNPGVVPSTALGG